MSYEPHKPRRVWSQHTVQRLSHGHKTLHKLYAMMGNVLIHELSTWIAGTQQTVCPAVGARTAKATCRPMC